MSRLLSTDLVMVSSGRTTVVVAVLSTGVAPSAEKSALLVKVVMASFNG